MLFTNYIHLNTIVEEEEKVREVLIEQLNRLYCAKAHLIERIGDINDEVTFTKIKKVLAETVISSEKQIKILDKVYDHLQTRHSFENCGDLINMLEKTFSFFQEQSTDDPDIAYLFLQSYLQQIFAIINASAVLLQSLARNSDRSDLEALIKQSYNKTTFIFHDQLSSPGIAK